MAIYDDPPPPISSSASSPTVITVDKSTQKKNIDADGVVEITNLNEPPSNNFYSTSYSVIGEGISGHGLKVVPESGKYSRGNSPHFAIQHRSEQSSSSVSFRRSPSSGIVEKNGKEEEKKAK